MYRVELEMTVREVERAEDFLLRPALAGGMRPRNFTPVSESVNLGGDGNQFALFIASVLSRMGAHVRVNLGCVQGRRPASGGAAAGGGGREPEQVLASRGGAPSCNLPVTFL